MLYITSDTTNAVTFRIHYYIDWASNTSLYCTVASLAACLCCTMLKCTTCDVVVQSDWWMGLTYKICISADTATSVCKCCAIVGVNLCISLGTLMSLVGEVFITEGRDNSQTVLWFKRTYMWLSVRACYSREPDNPSLPDVYSWHHTHGTSWM